MPKKKVVKKKTKPRKKKEEEKQQEEQQEQQEEQVEVKKEEVVQKKDEEQQQGHPVGEEAKEEEKRDKEGDDKQQDVQKVTVSSVSIIKNDTSKFITKEQRMARFATQDPSKVNTFSVTNLGVTTSLSKQDDFEKKKLERMKRFGIVPKTLESLPTTKNNKKGARENDPEFLKRKERISRFGADQYIDALRQKKRFKK
ncbi:unnamed protein product [Moneuplotes crassus]|uniref:Uncharacterized protein n=1 Tax=Euplotes crassus TaxID=5936 RepID=A0AAD1XW22_EUPCR|nr:unnamed protein product [Moneuplotes crassus]